MPHQSGPVPLSAVLDRAQAQMQDSRATHRSTRVGDGFLYSGNRHESVPRALFLDRRLTPLERNAWQVFRLKLSEDGITTFPTYEQLRPFLASMPGTQASAETVARALTILRLTRWLSLVRRQRDERSGRIVGNLYVLHDAPLTPFEAMQLDAEYLGLVSHALTHASKAVQCVGQAVLQEIEDDPLLAGRVLPTRLQMLSQRLADQGVKEQLDAAPAPETYPQHEAIRESEDGDSALLRNELAPPSDSESGTKPASNGGLRNPKTDRTVRTNKPEVRTVLGKNDAPMLKLRLPERFVALKGEQQAGAAVALRRIDISLQQAVLDEWDARCAATSVRNPAGYLFGIIQRAIRGEFKAWAAQPEKRLQPTPPPEAPSEKPRPAADPEVAQAHISQLRDMLQLR